VAGVEDHVRRNTEVDDLRKRVRQFSFFGISEASVDVAGLRPSERATNLVWWHGRETKRAPVPGP
jgi:hypothetical protein